VAERSNAPDLKSGDSKGSVSSNLTISSKNMKKIWYIWAKALGEKQGKTDADADRIALVRTLIVVSYIITNLFIVAGVIRHW